MPYLKLLKQHCQSLGFIVKDGIKFGVDFLLYTDKVHKVHSKYGVLLDRDYNVLQIIAVQRLMHSVRKKLILATIKNDEVKLLKIERFVINESFRSKF